LFKFLFMEDFSHSARRADLRGAASLSVLRDALARPELARKSGRAPLGHGEIDLSLNGGLRLGVVHEVFAVTGHEAAATGFVVGLASRVLANKRLMWIRQDFAALEFGELSATGLVELGLDPSRLLLLCMANAGDCLRAANDALSCVALGAVVIEMPGSPRVFDLVASRRLTLAAMQKSVTVFVLRFGATPGASSAETRWQVRTAPSPGRSGNWGHPVFVVDLIRNRHGGTGSWAVEWNCDAYCFQTPPQNYRPVVAAPAH
jgi:protein ImuA